MLNKVPAPNLSGKSRLTGKQHCFVLFFVLFIVKIIYGQSYLDNFPGIPIITYGWATNDTWLSDYDYNKVKEMGTDVYIAPDLISSKFETYRQANLKLIPYQANTAYVPVNHIAKYTEGIYSVWEAESVPISQGEIQLTQNTALVDEIPGVGVKTKVNQAGYLIEGPNYIQPVKYVIDTLNIIYTVKFNLKVEPKGAIVPLEDNWDNICRLEVTSNGTPLISEIIKARDFGNYSSWKTFEYAYSMNNNESLNSDKPVETSYLYTSTQNSGVEIFPNVEFKVYFYGTSSNYLDLYIDKIIVHDQRGNQIINNQQSQDLVINQANNVNNVNNITTNPIDFNNTVVGWYSIDEPSFIDQWACVKKIDSLIKYGTNGKKLVTSIAGSQDGKIYEGSSVYKINEFMHRTDMSELIVNTYIYDYPWNDNQTGYAEYNIENMLLNHLDIINDHPIPFVLSLQVGKWDAYKNLLEKVPTPAQLKNTMYLGLLYGAKGIAISNYFYNSIRIDTTSALVGFTELGGGQNQYNHDTLWYVIRDEINPLLHGTFGQTLKGLTQKYQGFNYDAVNAPIISDSYWLKKIEAGTQLKSPLADKCFVDYGYFADPLDANKKYAMIVNRYYSTISDLEIMLNNLTTYKNWEVKNLVNNSTRTVLANASNEASFSDNIPEGEAGFYTILPVVKYGGKLKYNEAITGTNTLLGEMTVESGATLTINGNYNINQNITVNAGGSIVINNGAMITFSSGKKLSIFGTLNANGATFQGNGSPGYWNAIYFYANSSGSIQNCTIRDAKAGIYTTTNANVTVSGCTITNNSLYGLSIISNSNVSISNCTISNNGTGINTNSSNIAITGNNILNNTNYGINGNNISSSFYWHDNTLQGNGYAMLLNNASPYVDSNFISNNTHGVVITSSSPNFANPLNQWRGYNAITCATTPLFKAQNYSTVFMGYDYNGGYNSIFGSDLPDMESINHSGIWADNNYWGSANPQVYADGTSWIYSRTPLDYDPNPGSGCSGFLASSSSGISPYSPSNEGETAAQYWEAIDIGRKD